MEYITTNLIHNEDFIYYDQIYYDQEPCPSYMPYYCDYGNAGEFVGDDWTWQSQPAPVKEESVRISYEDEGEGVVSKPENEMEKDERQQTLEEKRLIIFNVNTSQM
ncbi:unnamed protein product [Leptidea sinapis]|uniref:Uncharacterized protein n=1 Tax=Leptidea sinapis TaxID=189913 RepID=A0A5E4QP89_9NEOP|nr:unnamed protein product [Leptidea sinapis]